MSDLAAYHAMIARKKVTAPQTGLSRIPELSGALKPHQAHCVDFALRAGRAGHYLDTGLGKSFAALVAPRVASHDDLPEYAGLSDAQQRADPRYAEALDIWQRWASPVWEDTSETKVLNARVARDEDAEKHLCPMPLDLIDRCIRLWSNKGDVVLSPFAGIGSEGYMALKAERRFLGVELNQTYFTQAAKYLREAEIDARSGDLLDMLEAAE